MGSEIWVFILITVFEAAWCSSKSRLFKVRRLVFRSPHSCHQLYELGQVSHLVSASSHVKMGPKNSTFLFSGESQMRSCMSQCFANCKVLHYLS